MNKRNKKILVRSLLSLAFALGLFFILLFQLIALQTFVINIIAKNISDKMGGEITFETFYFLPFSGIKVENLYVEDDRKDTLLFVGNLNIDIESLDFEKPYIHFSLVDLSNVCYNLYSINEREQTNMQYIINHFSSASSDSTSGQFYLDVDQINVADLRFKYKSFMPDSLGTGINWGDIDLLHLDLDIQNFHLINDSMNFELNELFLKEKSGLQVNNLTTRAVVSSSEISLKDLVLKMPQSHLFAQNYSMNYKKWEDLGDFTDKVNLNLDLQLSSFNISDLAPFVPMFKEITLPTFAQGKIYGKIRQLKGKKILLTLGDHSRIETAFSIDGLPRFDGSFLNLNIKNLRLDSKDVEQLLQEQKAYYNIQVPELVKRLGYFHYKGDITGFLTDLVAYGTFDNDKGLLNTDLRFKFNKLNKEYLFKGQIRTSDLDLSVLNLSDTIFDKISMAGQINAALDSSGNWKGDLKGAISSVGINSYNYHNISTNASLENSILESQIQMNDSNLLANIHSKIDFSKKEPSFIINGQLEKANLSILKLWDRSLSSSLSFSVDAQFNSLKIDQFEGSVDIYNLKYFEERKLIQSDALKLSISTVDEFKNIELNSDLFDAHIGGHFTSQHLVDKLSEVSHKYLPAFFDKPKTKRTPNQDFKFKILLKQSYSAFEIFSPSFLIADGTEIKGSFTSDNNDIEISFVSDSCRIKDNLALDIDTKIKAKNEELYSDLSIQQLFLYHELSLKKVNLRNRLKSDSLNFYLKWMDKELKFDAAEIMAETIFHPSSGDSISCDINMIPSFLYIEDSIWYINDASMAVRGNQILIDQLVINNNAQYFYANGIWEKESSDSLQILLNRVDLAYFPFIDRRANLKVRGLVDGDIILSYRKDQPLASGYLRADNLEINDELLGNLSINANWENKTERLILDMVNELGRKHFESIKSNGYIDFRNSKVDIGLNLNKQKLSFFNPFVEPYLSDLKGYLSGDLTIKGTFDSLQYLGDLEFARAALTYNYLGTRYNFTNHIKITKDRFIFNDLKVFQIDGQGDYASVNGYIQHDNFSNFQFFINVDANDFMVLNTSQLDNELYYGSAFVTGIIEFTGTQQNLNIDISASTNKNTRFYIPLNDNKEAENSNFISFKNEIEELRKAEGKEEYKLDLSGITLNFDLKITPEAEIQLIFDDKLGDIVKARGNGNLNMSINTLGKFTMSGGYEIDKGEYLFTLQNVINKKFKIEPGSDIKWNGDPYQAFVNINAIYRLKTPLYDLTLNEEDKERVPVECLLKMEKSLMSPDITFDINLPSSGDRAKSLIGAMDQEEKNIQLLSLMLLSKFYTPEYLRGGEEIGSGNAVGKNASELLSNQLSSWLSQMSDDFDIGVNYRPGDEISNDELEVALSTQLFNDRVAVDGNIGLGDYEKTSSNIVGNVNVDVKINKKGTVRIRGFNRVNDNEMESSSLYTQGVGLYYRSDFDSFGELLRKYWKKNIRESKDSISQ